MIDYSTTKKINELCFLNNAFVFKTHFTKLSYFMNVLVIELIKQ